MMIRLAQAAMLLALAGCAANAPHHYSLQSSGQDAVADAPAVQPGYVISVRPVLIPQQVARPQIVVSGAAGAEVVPLNAALWAGPLDAQIRDTLAGALARRLNVMEIGAAKPIDGLPVWQIYFDVQRFDSVYGESVRQDVVWRLVPQGMPAAASRRVCSAQLRLPVATGMTALVQGHRQALGHLADLVAQSLPWPPDAAASVAENPPDGVWFRGCAG